MSFTVDSIEKDHLNTLMKLFEAFKDKEKDLQLQGVGHALVISKMILDEFKGQMDYIKENAEGSTFFFTFETD